MVAETTMEITGLDCSHCAARLRGALEQAEGVILAEVDPAGTASVRYDEQRLSEQDLDAQVRAAGFEVA